MVSNSSSRYLVDNSPFFFLSVIVVLYASIIGLFPQNWVRITSRLCATGFNAESLERFVSKELYCCKLREETCGDAS